MGMFSRETEYIELEGQEQIKELKKVPIQIEKMVEYSDSDRIQRKVREGAVLFVRIADLKQKNLPELKRAIERIKRTCEAVGGDVVGVGDDWLIVSPSGARVERA
jgi:SepF-like predicted cell division protein (DUF552 family)